MNSRFYVKINPKFKFKKISLNKQTDFNSYSSIKKILYHFDNKSLIKRYDSEFKQKQNNDNIFYRYKSELNQLINNKYVENSTSISNDKKISKINLLRSKILQNNNKLQYIDFNVNVPSNKDSELKLDINHYLSKRKNNNKISRNLENKHNIENHLSEDFKNNSDRSINKSNSRYQNKSNNLYLPHITTNIIRKRKNMRELIKMVDFNNLDKIDSIENIKKATISVDKKPNRDIFKNINYLLDNKKSKIKVNDIDRNINYINNSEDFEKYNFNKERSPLVNYKTSINDNEKNYNEEMNNKDMSKINEVERYMVFEGTRKYIETDKIYYYKKNGFPNIPNVNLDEHVKNVKNFESNILNMKNTKLDLPICIKSPKN